MNRGCLLRVAGSATWCRMHHAGVFRVLAAAFLADSNSADDNFKGVARLSGSGTCGDRAAITSSADPAVPSRQAALGNTVVSLRIDHPTSPDIGREKWRDD